MSQQPCFQPYLGAAASQPADDQQHTNGPIYPQINTSTTSYPDLEDIATSYSGLEDVSTSYSGLEDVSTSYSGFEDISQQVSFVQEYAPAPQSDVVSNIAQSETHHQSYNEQQPFIFPNPWQPNVSSSTHTFSVVCAFRLFKSEKDWF